MLLSELISKIEAGEVSIEEINSLDISTIEQDVDIDYLESRTEYWEVFQHSLKISLNSLYGALGNVHFVLFNRDVAASITGNGRIFIQGLANYINDKLKTVLKSKKTFVVYGDTDSVYFSLDTLIKAKNWENLPEGEILEKITKFNDQILQKWVREYIEIYADTFNAFNKSVIGAKIEKVADKGLFVAKKKYALRAIWDEGSVLVDNPKMAVTGLEIVRSSTPMFCRKYLKEMIEVILDKGEYETVKEIERIEGLFYEADIDDIARVSGIGSLNYQGQIGKYTTFKNGKTLTAPMNVRAALNYNHYLVNNGLDNKYPLITDSDKIKYIFLKKPNKLGDDVIAYLDSKFLVEQGFEKYYDKERMWEDFFVSPLKLMLEAADYDLTQNFEMEEWL